MSGINPVAIFGQNNYTTQDASTYKAQIDSNSIVAQRIVDNFAPRQTGTPAMTVTLDAGHIFNGVTLTEVASQVTGTITAPSSNPRIDRVVINAFTGAVSVITGAEAGSPTAPAITAGLIPIAQVLLQTTSTAITNSMITDERDLTALGRGIGLTTEATIASATTTDLGTLASHVVSITGTTPITSFGSSATAANPLYSVRFTGALTLTYNATSLILPTAANITTAAGDAAILKYEGSGNWRCVEYQRADGTAVGGGLFKAGSTTRDVSLASGSQSVTGVGFKPKAVLFFVAIGSTVDASFGFTDGSAVAAVGTNNGGTAGQYNQTGGAMIFITTGAGNTYAGTISSMDSDGFTISWTKSGSPTGTASISYLAIR